MRRNSWNRRAVEESAAQVYGAERWIKSATHVIRNDGSRGVEFPSSDKQRIHRVVVALGGKEKVPMVYGDMGKGFVHVFDEISLEIILKELNTISDFLEYLGAKERYYALGKETPWLAGEESLLAHYLHRGRKLPENYDVVMFDDDLWKTFIEKPEYQKKKAKDKISYLWDDVIEDIAKDISKENLEYSASPGVGEKILRVMAREDRFSRRILGKSFADFIRLSSENKVRSRILRSPASIIYVLLAHPHTIDRKYRRAELGVRCFIARGLNLDCHTIIGIATEQSERGVGHSFDLCFLHLTKWEERHQARMEHIQKESGFFANPEKTEAHEEEYPQ